MIALKRIRSYTPVALHICAGTPTRQRSDVPAAVKSEHLPRFLTGTETKWARSGFLKRQGDVVPDKPVQRIGMGQKDAPHVEPTNDPRDLADSGVSDVA